MSNVVRLKPSAGPPDALREEACQWVVRLESGLSTADQATLQAWLDRSPAHLRAFLDAAQVWDEASVLSELSEVFPLASYLPPKRQRQRMRTVGLSLAAAALLVCCLMPALYRLLPLGAVDHTPASPTLHYATRIGEHHTVLLPDGSSVVLNTNSQIDVQFTADSRDVHLRRGEAHFDVAKDSSRPFRVYANGGVVEAVGTAFTVQESGAEGLEVTVVEGVVNVTPLLLPLSEPAAKHEGEESLTQSEPAPVTKASERAPIALSAGESVQLTQQSEDVVKQKFRPDQLESKLAWRDGMLLFEGDPLEKVVREVSRYTAIRIDVDASVRDIEVLGYFRTGDIDGILLTMRDTFGVKVERLSEDHIVLKADN